LSLGKISNDNFGINNIGNSINYQWINQQQTLQTSLLLYNTEGKHILKKDIQNQSGTLNINNILSGLYIYSFSNSEKNISGKIYITN
jgi:hypothetical protein